MSAATDAGGWGRGVGGGELLDGVARRFDRPSVSRGWVLLQLQHDFLGEGNAHRAASIDIAQQNCHACPFSPIPPLPIWLFTVLVGINKLNHGTKLPFSAYLFPKSVVVTFEFESVNKK